MAKTILIDLDGVLNDYKGDYKKNYIHPPKTETKLFLENLAKYFKIKIFTTRNKILTSRWLIRNDLDKYIEDITNIKEPGTYLFIDDRCICFDGNYDKLTKDIFSYKEYWNT